MARDRFLSPDRLPEALGESESFLRFQERLSKAAKVERPVLLVGERGTGKELAAARLHYLSQRWQGPMIALNCAALSPSVLESELFGHEAGSFTGAARMRRGRFETASEGTLFLDEVGLIPMVVQEKILRVVEYGGFERVGGSEPVQVDVRIIGATNAYLPDLVEEGTFKADLLDRLSFEVLNIPPLRERKEDIVLLANHFASRMAKELGRSQQPEFSDACLEIMEQHDWPGNVRELKNAVERAVYRCESDVIEEIDFNPFQTSFLSAVPSTSDSETTQTETQDIQKTVLPAFDTHCPLPDRIRELEIQSLRQALTTCRHHQGDAAKRLGLTYHQFRNLYKKHRESL